MIGGFNTNVQYQGRTFHVQTEDSGHANPKIVTLLYEGGVILTSTKTSYEDRVSADNLEAVEWLTGECVRLAGEVGELEADPPELAECVARWHFTVTESRQLRRLLRRRQTLAPEQPLPFDGLKGPLRGKQINRRLRDWLDALPVEL